MKPEEVKKKYYGTFYDLSASYGREMCSIRAQFDPLKDEEEAKDFKLCVKRRFPTNFGIDVSLIQWTISMV